MDGKKNVSRKAKNLIYSVCHGEPNHHVGNKHAQKYAKKNEVIQSTAFRLDFLLVLAFRFLFVEISKAWFTSVTAMTLWLSSIDPFSDIDTDSFSIRIYFARICCERIRIFNDGMLRG
jgi:hypothetical protein